MTESISNCTAYCSPPSTHPRFYNHHDIQAFENTSKPIDTPSNCNDIMTQERDNTEPLVHQPNGRNMYTPGDKEVLLDDDYSLHSISQDTEHSISTYSEHSNTVISEALIKKCSKVVQPDNGSKSENGLEDNSFSINSDSSVSVMSTQNIPGSPNGTGRNDYDLGNVINAAPKANGPMSLPATMVNKSMNGSMSAITPKRRTSMLPKPEISPKPSHLTSMSPLRFQTNGYEPKTNKSPTYSLNVASNINGSNNQMSTSLQCQGNKKRSFEFEASPKKRSPVSHDTSIKINGTSPPYSLGISASCTTISTIDQPKEAINGDNNSQESNGMKDSKLADKTKGTASMLKSTLKRMSRLSIRSTGGSVGSSPRSLSPFVFKKSSSPPTQSNHTNDIMQQNSSIPTSHNVKTRRSIASNLNDISGKSTNFYSLNRQNSRKRSGIGTAHLSNNVAVDTYGPKGTAYNSGGMQNSQSGANGYSRSLSRSTSNSSSSSNINNIGGNPINGTNRSNSLKRPSRNKDLVANQKGANGNTTLQRSGSSSGTSSSSARDVKRSNSMHHHAQRRTFRDRDLNVKYSRGVQTQLTKDAASLDDDGEDITNFPEGGQFPTNVEFSVYLPDLLGSSGGDDVEAHVTEPTEPVDVRRNRQLQLDNMKLHREIEKLKSAANESDNLKRELRQVRSRLEEEQKSRAKIEHELDQHNDKVKLIAKSMDNVEQEFEFRDANIQKLETDLNNAKEHINTVEQNLSTANQIIAKQKSELSDALKGQKAVLKEYETAEAEAAELHEFLQAEKITLNEALKESEQEVNDLRNKVTSAEERCGQVVRLSEQRNQEILALEAQLKGVEDRAKEMLLSQDTEILQSSEKVTEFRFKIERLFMLLYPEIYKSEYVSSATSSPIKNDATPRLSNGNHNKDHIRSDVNVSIDSKNRSPSYKNLLVTDIPLRNGEAKENSSPVDPNRDVSLENLSNAIKNRKKISESNNSPGSCNQRAQSILLSLISNVDHLVQKLLEIETSEATKRYFRLQMYYIHVYIILETIFHRSTF